MNSFATNFSPLDEQPGMSEMQKELKRWELPKNRGGYGPNGFEAYPRMLYRAIVEQGKIIIDDQILCRIIAKSESEERLLEGQGWCHSPTEATAQAEREQESIGQEAAERAARDATMSPKAQQEAADYEGTTAQHVAEIPVAPKKRGRPKKVAAEGV